MNHHSIGMFAMIGACAGLLAGCAKPLNKMTTQTAGALGVFPI
jgi:hypothetical protein